MVVLTCPIAECPFQTPDVDPAGAAANLTIHGYTHMHRPAPVTPAPATAASKGPKLERPRVHLNCSPEDWNAFTRRWQTYKSGSGITDTTATGQLLECTSPELGNIVLRAHPEFTTKGINEALTLLRSLAVVPVALGVLRSELSALVQDAGESFRTFAARAQGKAETCEFTTTYTGTCAECDEPYTGSTYYTEERLRDVLLDGIADNDIRREALSVTDIHTKTINDVIAFVESREIARDANPSSGVSALSHYRRNIRQPPRNDGPTPPRGGDGGSHRNWAPSQEEQAQTAPCPDCGITFHLFKRRARGGVWNKKPHERCASCWKRNQTAHSGETSAIHATNAAATGDPFGQISLLSAGEQSPTSEPYTEASSITTSESHIQPNVSHPTTDVAPDLLDVPHVQASGLDTDESSGLLNEPNARTSEPDTLRTVRPQRRRRRRCRRTAVINVVTDRECPSNPGELPVVEPTEGLDVKTTATTDSQQPPTIGCQVGRRRRRRGHRRRGKPKIVSLSHQIFTKGEWRHARLTDHPRVRLSIVPERTPKPSSVDGIADSGAQSNLWSFARYLAAGYNEKDLSPVSLSLNAANKSPIKIEGAFLAEIHGTTADGQIITCKAMIYVSRDVQGFYLSYTTMIDLGMLPKNFPTPGCALAAPDLGTVHSVQETPQTTAAMSERPCGGCRSQESIPERPSELPFPCTPSNIGKMKQYLLDRYKAVFNTCPHCPLPVLDGPPMEIHINEDATPYACHTARKVPIHWDAQVHKDILRDVAIDVLEWVPHGEPVTWCHPMVVTRKHDGGPRRTVDLSKLNKQCKRETHVTESPFHAARRVPPNTYKTVVDAWNGYHSVELRESDRHLTTFITPYGLLRYKRGVQGFLSSGDAYNRRLDIILANFERKERVTDDTLHYDTDLEEHWWRTIDLLTTFGRAGAVLNPDKFQFSQQDVDFAGFHISEERIEPLTKYYAAIRDFPVPTSTTDIRSWFGLVNQVSNYAQLRDTMAPFRPFLSPRHPFEWTPQLEDSFTRSKDHIISSIKKGVEIFDPTRATCLRPDWSKKGIGYFLMQKHCTCQSRVPDCCQDGWRITLAGSRFLQDAEARYAPIEGEALAVAWGLEQSKYFTLGCDDLLVVTDHKPLVKILGDRMLDEIHNTRLFRLKQRTLPWRFSIVHLPGKSNLAADATSRHPSPTESPDLLTTNDVMECAIMASIRQTMPANLSISWGMIGEHTQKIRLCVPCSIAFSRDSMNAIVLIRN